METQSIKIGDVVAISGKVNWIGSGRIQVDLADYHAAHVDADAVPMFQPKFAVGDEVVIEGEGARTYTIKCIDGDFAWLFSEVEAFETAELSELRRPEANHQFPR